MLNFKFFVNLVECRLMLFTYVNACLNSESWVCGVGIDEKIGSHNIVISTDLMNELIAGSFG